MSKSERYFSFIIAGTSQSPRLAGTLYLFILFIYTLRVNTQVLKSASHFHVYITLMKELSSSFTYVSKVNKTKDKGDKVNG